MTANDTAWWVELYYASEWVIRLAMLVYVPQRRSPAAARTWLLAIFIFPWPALVLYSLFGRPSYPARRLELHQQVSRLVRDLLESFIGPAKRMRPGLPDCFAQTVTLVEQLGDFSITGDNRCELLTGYDEAIDRLVADIDAATAHVHLEYYIFRNDRTGGRVVEALRRAVARGVTCRLMIDSLGSRGALRATAPTLRREGIEVIELLPARWIGWHRARFDLRNHRKLAIIDGRIGYIGSQNLIDADFKPPLHYEELVVRVRGSAVTQLQVVFLADRYYETEERLHDASLFTPASGEGDTALQVLPSGPGFPHPNVQGLLVNLLYAARHSAILTTPYFVPDQALLQAMQTAVLRGVEVHLVVTKQLDQWMVGLAQRSFYDEMLEMGVKLHLYRAGFLHAKLATFDGEVALLGSSNFDLRSFLLNAEVNMLVYERQMVERLVQFQSQHIAQSDALTLAQWRQRPPAVRVLQNMARLVDSVL